MGCLLIESVTVLADESEKLIHCLRLREI